MGEVVYEAPVLANVMGERWGKGLDKVENMGEERGEDLDWVEVLSIVEFHIHMYGKWK